MVALNLSLTALIIKILLKFKCSENLLDVLMQVLPLYPLVLPEPT